MDTKNLTAAALVQWNTFLTLDRDNPWRQLYNKVDDALLVSRLLDEELGKAYKAADFEACKKAFPSEWYSNRLRQWIGIVREKGLDEESEGDTVESTEKQLQAILWEIIEKAIVGVEPPDTKA